MKGKLSGIKWHSIYEIKVMILTNSILLLISNKKKNASLYDMKKEHEQTIHKRKTHMADKHEKNLNFICSR